MTEPARTVTAFFNVKFDTAQLRNGQAFIDRVTKSLKVLGAAAGLGLAVKSIANFTEELTLVFDTISKGARTVSFSRRAFQEWQNTIELAGGSDRAFSKYVFFLQRGIGEAANGLKTYTDAFQQLALAPRELQKLRPEEQFEAVFNALGRVEDQTKRNALAQRLLGRGGRELTVAMKEQLGAHRKNREELHRLGAVISDEILIRSEKYADRMIWLTKVVQGFKARALDRVLDSAEPFVDFLIEAWAEMNRLADKTYLVETAILVLQAALAVLTFWFITATWPILLVVAGLAALFVILEDVYSAMRGGPSVISDWVESLTGSSLAEHLEFLTGLFGDWQEAMQFIAAWWNRDGRALFRDIAGFIWDMAKAAWNLSDGLLSLVGSGLSVLGNFYGDIADSLAPSTEFTPLPGSRTGATNQTIETNITLQSTGDTARDARNAANSLGRATKDAANRLAPAGIRRP